MDLTRTQRLVRIVEILQAGRKCGATTLAHEFGVSRRSIFRDMNVLRGVGLECYYDPDSESYALRKSLFLRPLDLTLDEGKALLMLTRKVVSERVLPAYRSMLSASLKIEAAVPDAVRKECGVLIENLDFEWPHVSDVGPVSDLIVRAAKSIATRRKIYIRYDTANANREVETTLRPYRVFFRRQRWYLVGHSERQREVRLFELERIVEMVESDRNFRTGGNFSLSEFFGNAWNIIRGDEAYHIEIVFGEKVAGNVEGVTWHPTQRTRRRSNGSLVFEADVDGIDEIVWWVLGYGDQAVVVQPDALRASVARQAEKMSRLYRRNSTTPMS